MTATYSKHLASVASPPQSVQLDSDQIENSAGGFVYEVDSFTSLRRFLVLGSEGGSYYANERDLTVSNIKSVEECIKIDGTKTVNQIVEISQAGRAPKNDPAILALALCVAHGDAVTKRVALSNVSKVCRIGTHLFTFVEFLSKLESLTGRSVRRALADWYNKREADQAAYQAVKYRQRNGWSHRDVLRVAHPKAVDTEHAALYGWVTKGLGSFETVKIVAGTTGLPSIVEGFEVAQMSSNTEETIAAIKDYRLPREAVKTEHLNDPKVQEALLNSGMGLTALIRNLGNMTRSGLLTATSDAANEVVRRLGNAEELTKARVHPLNVLFALKTYESGKGFRGTNTWTPVAKIVDALDKAFYLSFGNVESSGKNVMLAIDISGSMEWDTIAGTNITPRTAAGAMALVTAASEPNHEITVFSSGGSWTQAGRSRSAWGGREGIEPVAISPRQRLDDVLRTLDSKRAGGTDCALPMLFATETGRKVDTFVIYTDSETWAGGVHPVKALKDYRKASGINAKLVVVGMVANKFSIADPKDRGMLDVVGFDTATPQLITDFSLNRI